MEKPKTFAIYDMGDGTWFTGNLVDELWTSNPKKAKPFDTVEEAEEEIADCDPEEWLRDRLTVVDSPPAA